MSEESLDKDLQFHISDNSLENLSETISLYKFENLLIVTDENVGKLYIQQVIDAGKNAGARVETLTLATGEKSKTCQSVDIIHAVMIQSGFNRFSSCIIGLGGGVVSDISGFAAATYMRGVPLILIPTTLLSMVDASIGGKNAVNAHGVRNLIGTFKQPIKVFSDISTLFSLPDDEWRGGCSEALKTLIVGARIASFPDIEDIIARECSNDRIIDLIETCANIKNDIVSRDALDTKGERMFLNYGHTFGHALENAYQYRIGHGQAIACGIVFANILSRRHGGLDIKTEERIKHLCAQICGGRLFVAPSNNQMIASMSNDKKNHCDKISMVLFNGQNMFAQEICDDEIVESIEEYNLVADSVPHEQYSVDELLAQHREEIDDIDSKILFLLNARENLSLAIRHIKQENNMPITTPSREAEILEKLHQQNSGPLRNIDIDMIYGILLAVMKECPDSSTTD